jgi:hypothetical protein
MMHHFHIIIIPEKGKSQRRKTRTKSNETPTPKNQQLKIQKQTIPYFSQTTTPIRSIAHPFLIHPSYAQRYPPASPILTSLGASPPLELDAPILGLLSPELLANKLTPPASELGVNNRTFFPFPPPAPTALAVSPPTKGEADPPPLLLVTAAAISPWPGVTTITSTPMPT